MITRENRATVRFGTVGLLKRTPVIWVTLPAGRSEWSARLDGEYVDVQVNTPILVWGAQGNRRGRDYWLLDGQLYSTDVPLEPQEVHALIVERTLKEDARIARASAAAKRAALQAPARRAPIPSDVRSAVWQRDAGRCVECGSSENLEFDHVIPVSMGGAHTVRNLQLLCASCNAAKGGNLT
jgi:hypothetical protein